MTTPVVESTSTSQQGTAAFNHTVNLPSGIVSGDLLLLSFAFFSTDNAFSWPAGYTVLRTGTFGFSTLGLAYRQADGTEGASITVTTVQERFSSHIVYRISGADDPATQAPETPAFVNEAGSTTPNPPNNTPTGGAKDYLWICPGMIRSSSQTASAAPASFTNILNRTGPAASSYSSRRAVNASSLDPGDWTLTPGNNDSIVATVAIHPTPAPVVIMTGTVISAPSFEPDIVAGGKTIILTVANATWDADLGSDNVQTQDLIDGLDSDLAEAGGWDAVVKAGLTFDDVARTSATVATITLPAFAGFSITVNETITVIVPASALSSADPITPSPTTFGVEAAASDAAVVEATNTSTHTAGSPHTVDLPAGIVAGELLIIIFSAADGLASANLSGWTKLAELLIVSDPNGRITFAVFHKIADGTEGASVNVTTVNQNSAHNTYRISGHDPLTPPEITSIVTAVTATPNPPSLTPSGGEDNYLWIAMISSNKGFVSGPSNYTDVLDVTVTGDAGTASMRRSRNIATEDPGIFTVNAGGDTDITAAATLVVFPALSVAAAPGGPVQMQQREILLS